MRLNGRTIYPGFAQGKALVSKMGLSFFGGVDPESGVVVERGHDLEGQSVAGKILVFPTGKGSTVGSYTLYRLKANQKAPLAILNAECETITAVGCIIAEIACIDQIPVERIRDGQALLVDGKSGQVTCLPGMPLPEPLRGTDGSFTYYTITERLPSIAKRVIDENPLQAEAREALKALIEEIPEAKLRLLDDPEAPDCDDWNRVLHGYLENNWLEAPWFVVETYFFRRILEASGYFRVGAGKGVDPYRTQKSRGLVGVMAGLEPLCWQLEAGYTRPPADRKVYHEKLAGLFRRGVWANQSDLSMWPAGSGSGPKGGPGGEATGAFDSHLARDDAQVAAQYVLEHAGGNARIDFILDNGGPELSHDLVLADFFLTSRLAREVVFHCKAHPTYVSDVVRPDVDETVRLMDEFQGEAVQNLAKRLKGYLNSKQLILRENYFWNSALSGWEMPYELWDELSRADLIINKGDQNYRRWLGDRHWEAVAPLEQVLDYLPATWLALRVFKAEIVAGLSPGTVEELSLQDSTWMYDGRWGMIEFIRKI